MAENNTPLLELFPPGPCHSSSVSKGLGTEVYMMEALIKTQTRGSQGGSFCALSHHGPQLHGERTPGVPHCTLLGLPHMPHSWLRLLCLFTITSHN